MSPDASDHPAKRVVPLAVVPQLMFTGDASAALELYTSVFGDSVVETVSRGDDGSVAFATLRIGAARLRVIDSPPVHEFTFTPSLSLAVDCATAADVDAVVTGLGAGGQVFMPLDTYPFSERYSWFSDRFGVSWQVGVAAAL